MLFWDSKKAEKEKEKKFFSYFLKPKAVFNIIFDVVNKINIDFVNNVFKNQILTNVNLLGCYQVIKEVTKI